MGPGVPLQQGPQQPGTWGETWSCECIEKAGPTQGASFLDQHTVFLSTDTALRVREPGAVPDIFPLFPYCL